MVPTHLTASMQVIRAYQRRRLVTVEEARRAVSEVAQKVADGLAGPQTLRLAEQLEKMTGCTIAELARHAQHWPEF